MVNFILLKILQVIEPLLFSFTPYPSPPANKARSTSAAAPCEPDGTKTRSPQSQPLVSLHSLAMRSAFNQNAIVCCRTCNRNHFVLTSNHVIAESVHKKIFERMQAMNPNVDLTRANIGNHLQKLMILIPTNQLILLNK
ncbi:hypothetical protein COLO4_36788 [Corchorus olitorius]|uniref:Uncharacterized protein n=1 Tax=Corchorus olitorius TaxID=93759 RepID=A0A1R3G5B9_9ROSI|nr:hypothetical protein COLO4_36788 [Corchorus olitorius]